MHTVFDGLGRHWFHTKEKGHGEHRGCEEVTEREGPVKAGMRLTAVNDPTMNAQRSGPPWLCALPTLCALCVRVPAGPDHWDVREVHARA